MIKVKDIPFVSYPSTDLKRSREFYEGIFGLVPNPEFPVSDDNPWVEYIIGSGAFAVGSMPDWKPSSDGPGAAFEVEDFDAAIAELKERGVKFAMEPQTFPNCRMAIIHDPDGNTVNIHRHN